MPLIILALWFGYKKAKATGRNAVLWAVICAAAFLATQLFAGFAIGVVLGAGVSFLGWRETVFYDYSLLITGIALIASCIVLYLLVRYLDGPAAPEEQILMPLKSLDTDGGEVESEV